ncbi:MAG: ribulose-phosphate 3-epimerase [Candidatus Stahlbacteria bacterium]|nr:ribulose-phosphate 3-epimerase [Candidatus Stahlbacteria bacterium]
MIQIAPSLLACDFSHLEQEIRMVEKAGANVLHLDVMDGHFVPNITFGPVIIEGIRKLTNLPLDVHLMIDKPEKWVNNFVIAGADWISFHIEATTEVGKTIKLIKESNKLAGIALNPDTELEAIIPWVKEVDFVVVMTVNPGFGGQEFIKEPLEKVRVLNQRDIRVEVDGGVKMDTLPIVLSAGADIIVSGSGIFRTLSPSETIKNFKEMSENVKTL